MNPELAELLKTPKGMRIAELEIRKLKAKQRILKAQQRILIAKLKAIQKNKEMKQSEKR